MLFPELGTNGGVARTSVTFPPCYLGCCLLRCDDADALRHENVRDSSAATVCTACACPYAQLNTRAIFLLLLKFFDSVSRTGGCM